MKLTTALATTLIAAAMLPSAQAGGVVFNTPVTYTESVTYAAGVTYLAPVTYGPTAMAEAHAQAAATPVLLDRVIVTPSRRYTEHEWHARLASPRGSTPLWSARAERRHETRSRSLLRVLLSPL